jgi:biopolymer transport protein ExbD
MAINASSEGEGPTLDVDMTPLIDVVFLLLIFFMIISVFNNMERKADVELPVGYHAQIAKDVAKERMVINIEEDGTIVLYNQDMNMAAFRKQLSKYEAGLKKLAEKSGAAPIVVRGDQDCPYEHVKKVLGAIYDERFKKIMFAAYEKKQEGS